MTFEGHLLHGLLDSDGTDVSILSLVQLILIRSREAGNAVVSEFETVFFDYFLRFPKLQKVSKRLSVAIRVIERLTHNVQTDDKIRFCAAFHSAWTKVLPALKNADLVFDNRLKLKEEISHLEQLPWPDEAMLSEMQSLCFTSLGEREETEINNLRINVSNYTELAMVLYDKRELNQLIKELETAALQPGFKTSTRRGIEAERLRSVEQRLSETVKRQYHLQKETIESLHYLLLRCIYDIKKVEEKVTHLSKNCMLTN